jgi:CDP-paratose synthetase
MRILMTGATGYLGRHLVAHFEARGDEIHAIHRANSNLQCVESDAIVWHDVARPSVAIIADVRPDVVLHAATHYGRDGAADAEVTRANFTWPMELLDAAVTQRVGLFVNTDTSLPAAISEYARTKRTFANAAKVRADAGDIRMLNIRLESVYGPGDDRAKFQMALFEAVRSGVASFPLTRGEQTRDYIYVDDAVEAIALLVDHARRVSDPYLEAGVGAGREVSIRTFAETLAEAAREGSLAADTRLDFGALPYRDGELMHACADISLLTSLGWKGARSLEQGLQELIRKETEVE